MNESKKIEEARYFLAQMRAERLQPQHFEHNLSAFVADAQTLREYAEKEVSKRQGGREWYNRLTKSDDILSFFTKKETKTCTTLLYHPGRGYNNDLGAIVYL